MIITMYSIIMGIVWFTAAITLGSVLLKRFKGKNRQLIYLIFSLGIVRLTFPVEMFDVYVIRSWGIYPTIKSFLNTGLWQGITVAGFILSVLLAGTVISMFRLTMNLLGLQQTCHQAIPVARDSAEGILCEQAMKQVGYKGPFRLATSDNFSTAVSAGYFHPCILLPKQVLTFSKDELCGIFQHETVHFLLKDQWIKLGLLVLKSVLWWNPAVYLLSHSVEHMLELRCDRIVCQRLSSNECISYLSAILHTLKDADDLPLTLPLGHTGGTAGQQLLQRFGAVLHPQKELSKKSVVVISAFCILVFLLSYSFIFQPAGLPDNGFIDENQAYELEVQESFILRLPDGTNLLIKEGKIKESLSDEQVKEPPYNSFEIVKGE